MSKQGGSAYSREFDRFYFFSDAKTKENVTQIPKSARSQVPSNKMQQTRDTN